MDEDIQQVETSSRSAESAMAGNPSRTSLTISVDRPVYDRQEFVEEFTLVHPDIKLPWTERLKRQSTAFCQTCTPKRVVKGLLGYVPLIQTLTSYKWRQDILMDALAGVSVGMVHLPQGMGFALLAAVKPVYGLYASFWQVLIYALLGHCRHLSIGTMAVISLLIGAVVEREVAHRATLSPINTTTVASMTTPLLTHTPTALILRGESENKTEIVEGLSEEDYFKASIACSVSLIAAATMFFMGVFRLGILTTFMPPSFIGGFTTGAAFHITTTQLKPLINVAVKRHGGMFNLPRSIFEIIKGIPRTNIGDLVISIICFSFLVFIKEFVNVKFKKRLRIPIPAEMIVVVLVTILSYAVDFESRWGVKVIGYIPPGIPGPAVPNMDRATTYIIDGVVAGLTSFAISISMVDILTTKHKYKADPNKELIAYGVTYGATSFLHCFAGAAAPPRCFVMEMTGGKTQVASIFTSLLLLLVLLVIAPVFRYLPNASLACIIIVALFPLFKQFAVLPRLWRVSKPDFVIWVVTWLVCVIVDVSVSLGVGIFVAIMCSVLPSVKSKGFSYEATIHQDLFAPIQTHKGVSPRKDIVIFRYESTLYFVTIKNFKKQLYKAAFDPARHTTQNGSKDKGNLERMDDVTDHIDENHQQQIHGIVYDCSTVCYVDLMALDTLAKLRQDYADVGVEFVLADCNPSLIKKLEQAGMLDGAEGCMPVFPTVQDAVAALSPTKTFDTAC